MNAAANPHVRLLTLVGTGGTGKTRLAVAVAAAPHDEFEHGVFFVDLTTAAGAADVVPAIARVLGLQDLGNRVLVDRLGQYLATRRLLLVLDNFEHVLGAGPQIAELLTSCPLLEVVVTSRAALRLRWEQEFPVLPLAVPDPSARPSAAAIAAVPSVILFVQRAQSARPEFELTDQNAAAVAAIYQRLDGLPLRAAIAWSYDFALPDGTNALPSAVGVSVGVSVGRGDLSTARVLLAKAPVLCEAVSKWHRDGASGAIPSSST